MNTPLSHIRTATWLELFYDLAYVAAIAKLAHHLPEYLNSPVAYLAATLVLIPIWWSWAGHTYFANRFEREDATQKVMVFLQLFFVVLLIVSIDPLFEHHPALFIWSYFLARLVLVAMYCREAMLSKPQRGLITKLCIGFSIGLIIWIISLFFDSYMRYVLWATSILVDVITLLVIRDDLKEQANVQLHHLAERTGLFTIIMLGEVIVGLVAYLEHAGVSVYTLAMMASGFGLLVLLWWLYFYVTEPLLENNPILESQLHGYSNLLIFISIILFSSSISAWSLDRVSNAQVNLITAIALSLFCVTIQIIVGKHAVFNNRLGLNIFRYSYSLLPLVLALITTGSNVTILEFNLLMCVVMTVFALTNNFSNRAMKIT